MDTGLNLYILFWVCVFGLCLGSFYNVVILRSLSGESIFFPPSKCPKCGEKLKPWHNIPVFSYLFLRGRCAYCREKISLQYPLVEIASMLLFAASYLRFGLDIKTLFVIVLGSGLLIMSVTDIREKVVDCNIAIGMAIIGILYNVFVMGNIAGSFLGLLAGVVIIEGIARLGKLFFGVRAFGEADTYVAGTLGACFGLRGLIYTLGYSLVAAMIFIVPIFLYKQYKENNKLTCILSVLFIISALAFKTLTQNYLTMSLVIVFGIALSVSVLKGFREQENKLYLPLVPAFVMGALYYIYF